MCNLKGTPKQPLGPFYPESIPLDSNQDLTVINGNYLKAEGEVIIIKGIVQDNNCNPVRGAIVEIWQACHTGNYLHASDTSNNILDPNFQYYGKVKTNSKGEYEFKTILPGKYNDFMSPPLVPRIYIWGTFI